MVDKTVPELLELCRERLTSKIGPWRTVSSSLGEVVISSADGSAYLVRPRADGEFDSLPGSGLAFLVLVR